MKFPTCQKLAQVKKYFRLSFPRPSNYRLASCCAVCHVSEGWLQATGKIWETTVEIFASTGPKVRERERARVKSKARARERSVVSGRVVVFSLLKCTAVRHTEKASVCVCERERDHIACSICNMYKARPTHSGWPMVLFLLCYEGPVFISNSRRRELLAGRDVFFQRCALGMRDVCESFCPDIMAFLCVWLCGTSKGGGRKTCQLWGISDFTLMSYA